MIRVTRYGNSDHIVGGPEDDRIEGGPGSDYLQGRGGADTFVFRRGDGHDYILDFETGVDRLEVHSSPRQISYIDTRQGLEIYYANFGQTGPDHFLLADIHTFNPNDF